MNYREQEDGRGYAVIGRSAWPIDQCTKVEMLQEGSISGMVFQRGDVVWIPTDSLLLYPHRLVSDEPPEQTPPTAPPVIIPDPPPDPVPAPERPEESLAPLLSPEAPTPPPPTKTKRSLFGGSKKKEPSR